MKENKGITMITLVITIVILIILAGISIGQGGKTIERSKLENLKTNMLLIEAKAKQYVETANFKLGTNSSLQSLSEQDKIARIEESKKELIGEEITTGNNFLGNIGITDEQIQSDNQNYIYYYKLSSENLEKIGIKDVKSDEKNGYYIVKYNVKDIQIEIYNTKGFSSKDKIIYSLNEMKDFQI